MPAESKAQQGAAGAALAVKRGQAPKSSLRGASRSMFNSMTAAELADFARSPRTTRETIGTHPDVKSGSSHKPKRKQHKSRHRK